MLWLPHGTVDHRPAVGISKPCSMLVWPALLDPATPSTGSATSKRAASLCRMTCGWRVPSPTGVKGGLVAFKRDKARLRHLWNWSIGRGHADATPFKRGTATVIALDTTNGVEDARTRRLEPGISALAAEGWRPPQASPVL